METNKFTLANVEHFCLMVKSGESRFLDVLEEIEINTGYGSDMSIEFCKEISMFIVCRAKKTARECMRSLNQFNINPLRLPPAESEAQPEVSQLEVSQLEQKPPGRPTYKHMKWAKSVKNRDQNTCKRCGSQNNLHAHHVVSHWQQPDNWHVSNGITLCAKCHREYHRFFGP